METLVKLWFEKWEQVDFYNLPISENFKHTSPFGTIKGKKEYLTIVEENKDKFLGYHFIIKDQIFNTHNACVCYKAIQGDFTLDVSE